jgi:hypothetical protein
MKNPALAVFFLFLLFPSAAALDAPEITEPTNGSWYTLHVYVKWNPVEDATGYAYSIDREPDGTVPSTVECVDSTSKMVSRTDGVWYFHVASCSDTDRSSPSHVEFRIDNTAPSIVKGLTVEPTDDGKLRLTWEAATDELSGVDHYTLYRSRLSEFGISDLSTKKFDNITGTEYIDRDVEERGHYNYKIGAVDVAGTKGIITLKSKGAKTIGKCDFNVTLSLDYNSSGQSLAAVASADGTMKDINLFFTVPGGVRTAVVQEDTGNEVSYEVNLAGKEDGLFIAELEAFDEEGDSCSAKAEFSYDSTKPSVSWDFPKQNAKVSSSTEVSFTVSDPGFSSGMKEVKLYIAPGTIFRELKPLSQDGDKYTFPFDINTYESGRYTLKVIARDEAGNKDESLVSFSILNIASDREGVMLRIERARTLSSETAILLQMAAALEAADDELLALAEDAESSISLAEGFFDSNSYAEAGEEAEKAVSSLEELESKLSFSDYASDSFSFTRQKLKDSLEAAGFSAASAAEAERMHDIYSPVRSIVFSEAAIGDANYFFARVMIEASISDANDYYFYETVPEELFVYFGRPFLLSGQQQVSGKQFMVKGSLTESGGKLTAQYLFLPEGLSKEDADSFVSDRVIQKYSLPPVVFDRNASSLAGQFSAGFLSPELLMAAFAAAIIISGAAILFFLFRKRLSGKSGKKFGL